MIYRITIILPRDNELDLTPQECLDKTLASLTWSLEAVLCMESLGLPAPGKFANNKGRFYFTEFGWSQVGRHVAAELQKHNFQLRVRCQKNPDNGRVVYRDAYQVALLPSRPSRKGNNRRRRTK